MYSMASVSAEILDLVDRILTTSQGREAFRAYIGYSGWGPGQLESEMQTGSWITIPADPNIVFEKDPRRIWPDIVSALGDDYRHMPICRSILLSISGHDATA